MIQTLAQAMWEELRVAEAGCMREATPLLGSCAEGDPYLEVGDAL